MATDNSVPICGFLGTTFGDRTKNLQNKCKAALKKNLYFPLAES